MGTGGGRLSQLQSTVTRGSHRSKLVLAALAGALVASGHAPIGLSFNAAIGFTLLFWLALGATVRQAAWIGWASGVGHFGLALAWIVEPFLVDVATHGWMAPFALFFLASGLALFWAGGMALGAFLSSGPWRRALALATSLALFELARGYLLTGFPWALPAYTLAETSAFQLLALLGPYGLTWLWLLCGAAVAALLATRSSVLWLAMLPVPGMLIGLAGALTLNILPEPDEDGPLVRLVQPNAAQHEKWDPEKIPLFLNRQLEFTAAEGAPAAVIWPETAIPYFLESAGPLLEEISARSGGAPVVIGAQRGDVQGVYNSLAVVSGGQATAVYDKHHLVPFGEYMPVRPVSRWLGLVGLAALDRAGYTPGPGPRVVEVEGLGSLLPLICYEAVFPQHSRFDGPRPRALMQITNDAWFGTWSGPFQHLDQARARAIEQGLPMVRVANTGVSAVITARGEVTAALSLGLAGYLDAALPGAAPATPYARSGDAPLAVAIFVALAFAGAFRKNRN